MSELRRAAWVERAPGRLEGEPTTRLMIVLRARGCAWARRAGGGCTMCGFDAMTTGGEPVSTDDLVAQLDDALGRPGVLDEVGELDLYNSGSFLADAECPPEARARLFIRVAQTPVRRVLIESRPEYVRAAPLQEALRLLGHRQLEVGIGLESADDRVREVLIRKGFSRADFERAVATLGAVGALLLTYVVVKPGGLDEQEAISDAVATVKYVFEVAAGHGVRARVALQPAFVPHGTPLEREFLAGRYLPPALSSVVEVVRRAQRFGDLQVGLSDEGLASDRVPQGPPALRAALVDFNRTGQLDPMQGVHEA